MADVLTWEEFKGLDAKKVAKDAVDSIDYSDDTYSIEFGGPNGDEHELVMKLDYDQYYGYDEAEIDSMLSENEFLLLAHGSSQNETHYGSDLLDLHAIWNDATTRVNDYMVIERVLDEAFEISDEEIDNYYYDYAEWEDIDMEEHPLEEWSDEEKLEAIISAVNDYKYASPWEIGERIVPDPRDGYDAFVDALDIMGYGSVKEYASGQIECDRSSWMNYFVVGDKGSRISNIYKSISPIICNNVYVAKAEFDGDTIGSIGGIFGEGTWESPDSEYLAEVFTDLFEEARDEVIKELEG